jgi:aspartate aminotransferase
MRLSDRMEAVEESKTVGFTQRIQRFREAGREIIDLAVGEPDFGPPPAVTASTRHALDRGMTRYGPVPGLPELRERIAAEMDGYGPENILITNGAKQALYSVFQVVCNPGDEVIVPRPCWVSFAQQIRLAGGLPVFVDTVDHALNCRGIADAVTDRTRAVLVNSPNNPTGAVYPGRDLESIAELARENNLVLISDEAYCDFVYDRIGFESPADLPAIRDRLVVIRSFSKRFGMTGFRVGYAAAPMPVIEAMIRLQGHLTGNVCTFVQAGALAAVATEREFPRRQLAALQENRNTAFAFFSREFACIRPRGGFYLFPDVSARLTRHGTSEAFCAFLLETAGVAVVPGEAFGAPGHVRVSFAVSGERLETGLQKIGKALLSWSA